MLVEDDETLADNMRTWLAKHGWEVSVFHNVDAALAQLEAVRPDVIVADYMDACPPRTGATSRPRGEARATSTSSTCAASP